ESRSSALGEVRCDQDEPPLLVASTVPAEPTARQLALGQLTAARYACVGEGARVHVDPFLVVRVRPWTPTATQEVGVAQLMPLRNPFVPESCADQVEPES